MDSFRNLGLRWLSMQPLCTELETRSILPAHTFIQPSVYRVSPLSQYRNPKAVNFAPFPPTASISPFPCSHSTFHRAKRLVMPQPQNSSPRLLFSWATRLLTRPTTLMVHHSPLAFPAPNGHPLPRWCLSGQTVSTGLDHLGIWICGPLASALSSPSPQYGTTDGQWDFSWEWKIIHQP